MKLGVAQKLFAHLFVRLIDKAHEMGFQVVIGDVHRSIEEATRLGFPNSNHTRCLAGDINLFKDGVYLTKTEDHRELGEWWEQQHELCRWGGRFGDGNHYSLEHRGVR